jgi:SAM-dependent methyltransferase/methyltransferase-like protein
MSTSSHPDSRSQAEAFEAHPYAGSPCVEANPSHIAVIARLSGLDVGDIRRCRVLELACGDANNLIAIAESMPEATCVGIDLSPRHIDIGRAEVSALGLKNVTLHAADLLQMTPGDAALGEFDFIIAHGFYSWVPRQVQDRFFEICRRHLSKKGLAYVSYNLLPGWRIMQVVRDFLSFHLRSAQGGPERLRKAIEGSDLLLKLGENPLTEQARFLNSFVREFLEHIEKLGVWRDQALLHDVVSEFNTPVYFSTFVNHAARFELRYAGDCEFRDGVPPHMAESAVEKLVPHVQSSLDLAQYLDFARMRMFRQSVLCREHLQPRTAQPEDLYPLYVSSRLLARTSAPPKDNSTAATAASAEFVDENGDILRTDHPLTRAAVLTLAEQTPHALQFHELCELSRKRLAEEGAKAEDVEDDKSLAACLLWAFASDNRRINLHAYRPEVVKTVSSHPRARGFARRQLQRSPEVTTLYHTNVGLDALGRKLVPLLDGTRDVAALTAELAASGPFEGDLEKEIREQLEMLARLGVLVA